MLKKTVIAIFSIIGMLLLILDSKTAVNGAVDGIYLCINTLIPALFPFLILSSFLVKSIEGRRFRFMKWVGKFCGIPAGAEYIFLIGLIGGYPIGAKMVGDAYQNGTITRKDAQHMLGFCSNAGPAFIFGVIGPQFGYSTTPWLIWLIHIISAILAGHLLGNDRDTVQNNKCEMPISLLQTVESAVKTIAIVSAWVVLFRILLFTLKKMVVHQLPIAIQITFAGFLELTNGCVGLSEIANVSLRFIVCTGMLSFGGMCVIMQTGSVTSSLGFGKYFPGKLLQTLISVLLSIGIQAQPVATAVIIPLCLIYKQIRRKRGRFSVVNAV